MTHITMEDFKTFLKKEDVYEEFLELFNTDLQFKGDWNKLKRDEHCEDWVCEAFSSVFDP